MIFPELWRAIEATPLAQFITSSPWAFPNLESVHVIAITIVFGTVAVMDFRLLGLASVKSRVTEVEHDTLRWTWGAFVLAVVTGGLLFISKAPDYANNPYFLWKLVLIALAGVNMAIFHLITRKKVASWDLDARPPGPARLAGALSITLWIAVVFLARMIGFTLDKFSPG